MTLPNVPDVFSPDTVIFSAQVNANFASVVANAAAGGVNADITSMSALTSISGSTVVIPVANGGTGATSNAGTAFAVKANNLSDLASVATAIVNLSQLLSDISTASWVSGDLMYYNGSHLVRLPKGTAGQVLATGTPPFWQASGTVGLPQPKVTVLTSGSAATFTSAAGATHTWVRLIGGGGGGGGSTGNGGDGADTTFGALTGSAGKGGKGNGARGVAAGGAAAGGDVNLPGSSGPIAISATNSLNNFDGVPGAAGLYGAGAGAPGIQGISSGGTAGANTGAGGGGCANGAAQGGGGGGSGGYVEKMYIPPAATYTYTVGAAGAAGTGGSNLVGGAGAAGIIIVIEYFD